MKKAYFTIILLVIIFLKMGCKKSITEKEIIVDKLLSFSFEMPPSPQLSFLPIFIKQSDTVIYSTTTYGLKLLYDSKNYLQEISFYDFVLNSFNQKTILKNTNDFIIPIRLKSKIYDEYLQNDFEFIINKYTDESDGNTYILKCLNLDFDTQSTISYIFFLNNYFTIFDGLHGETSYLTFRECLDLPTRPNNK